MFERLAIRPPGRGAARSRSPMTRSRASTTRPRPPARRRRVWPESTRANQRASLGDRVQVYQLRNGGSAAHASLSTLSIIPASGCSTCRCCARATREWSVEATALSRGPHRRGVAAGGTWLKHLATIDPTAPADESIAIESARPSSPPTCKCVSRRSDYAMSLAAARPLPDARRSRGLAGVDICAAGYCRRASSLPSAAGWGHDEGSAATRTAKWWCNRFYRGALYALFDRPDRTGQLLGAERGAGGHARSARRAGVDPRLLPDRPRRLVQCAVSAARQRDPVCRNQGRPSASRRPRPPGSHPFRDGRERDCTGRLRRRRSRCDRAPPPSARPAKATCAARAVALPSIIGLPTLDEPAAAGEKFDGRSEIAVFPAICRPMPARCSSPVRMPFAA